MTGNPAAGLLVLLAGCYLLLAFFTGRLEWLFNMGGQVQAARATTPAPAGAAWSSPAPMPYPGGPSPAGEMA